MKVVRGAFVAALCRLSHALKLASPDCWLLAFCCSSHLAASFARLLLTFRTDLIVAARVAAFTVAAFTVARCVKLWLAPLMNEVGPNCAITTTEQWVTQEW